MATRNLDFSDEVTLGDNQYNSIVIDIPTHQKDTKLYDYGSIKSNTVPPFFTLKRGNITFGTPERDYDRLKGVHPVDTVGKQSKPITNFFTYSIKVFPHFGAYGFVNYSSPEAEEEDKVSTIFFGDDAATLRGEIKLDEIE